MFKSQNLSIANKKQMFNFNNKITMEIQNEKPKRLFPSTQLIVALEPRVLKTYLWICSWMVQGGVRYYSRQFAKATKLTEDEVERCIQALIDYKLVDVTNTDQGFVFMPNVDQAKKYFEVPMGKVLESEGIKMAETATWNKESVVVQKRKIEDMNAEQIQAMIYRLQASLEEKKQMEKFVKVTSSPTEKFDDLPF